MPTTEETKETNAALKAEAERQAQEEIEAIKGRWLGELLVPDTFTTQVDGKVVSLHVLRCALPGESAYLVAVDQEYKPEAPEYQAGEVIMPGAKMKKDRRGVMVNANRLEPDRGVDVRVTVDKEGTFHLKPL